MQTLPKSERLHGKSKISALMSRGRWGFTPGLKYCFLKEASSGGAEPEPNGVIVSVPKRLFKRAVKRNLLKRRLRESYRTQKELLPARGHSILLLYNTKEILEYSEVRSQVAMVLKRIAGDEA